MTWEGVFPRKRRQPPISPKLIIPFNISLYIFTYFIAFLVSFYNIIMLVYIFHISKESCVVLILTYFITFLLISLYYCFYCPCAVVSKCSVTLTKLRIYYSTHMENEFHVHLKCDHQESASVARISLLYRPTNFYFVISNKLQYLFPAYVSWTCIYSSG